MPTPISCSALEFVNFCLLRFNELGAVDRKWLVQNFAQFLRQNNGDGASVSSVNRDGKRAGITVGAVDGAVGFPHAIGVAGGMIGVTHEKNFCPKTLVQSMLGLNQCQIIAG